MSIISLGADRRSISFAPTATSVSRYCDTNRRSIISLVLMAGMDGSLNDSTTLDFNPSMMAPRSFAMPMPVKYNFSA